MTAAMARGVRSAYALHKAMRLPVATWRDGKVELLDPETLQPVAWPAEARDDRTPPAG